jgi:putative ABC transport system substrate-binding protein
MLRSVAPKVTRVGLMFNPETYPYYDVYLKAFRAEGHASLEIVRAAVRTPDDIETAVAELAARPGGGLAVPPDPFTVGQRAVILRALAHHRLPHIFTVRQFVREGGLMSYGPDTVDIFRRSAAYADSILKGANPGELPAQAPDKFELAINLSTARSLGLEVPATVLAIADEVIE